MHCFYLFLFFSGSGWGGLKKKKKAISGVSAFLICRICNMYMTLNMKHGNPACEPETKFSNMI